MRNLMLSTAILTAFGGVALAQDATAPGRFRAGQNEMDVRASDFIGMRVYASETPVDAAEYDGMQEGWNDIGEINDVILSRDGTSNAVLVDIGGFLGVGERQVAVDMKAIQFVSDASTTDNVGDYFLVMSVARADLESAPDYMKGDTSMTTDDTLAAAPAVEGTTSEVATDTTTGTMREPIARDGYAVAESEYLTSDKLTGARVYDANDDWIGDVSNLVIAEDGKITQAVIDVGGFLGIGQKPVAVDLTDVDILRNKKGNEVRVYLSKTKAELEAMPDFKG